MNKIIFYFVIIAVIAQIYATPQAPAAAAEAAQAPAAQAPVAAATQDSPAPSGRLSPFFLLQPLLNIGKSMVVESEKALNQLLGAFPGRARN